MAGVRHVKDFVAWQLAEAFKKEVFGLIKESPAARQDFRYRGQLQDAAGGISKHITEGYLRFSPLDFARFLDYALGSLGEAELRLSDGIELGFFTEVDCREAFRYAKRCLVATVRLKRSQIREAASNRRRDPGQRIKNKQPYPGLRPKADTDTGREPEDPDSRSSKGS